MRAFKLFIWLVRIVGVAWVLGGLLFTLNSLFASQNAWVHALVGIGLFVSGLVLIRKDCSSQARYFGIDGED